MTKEKKKKKDSRVNTWNNSTSIDEKTKKGLSWINIADVVFCL